MVECLIFKFGHNKVMKLLRGSPRHLEARGKLERGSVRYVSLNMPFSCNYRCLKCCNEGVASIPGTRLSPEEIRKVLLKAKEMGAKAMPIMGDGEPLARRETRVAVEQAHALGMTTIMFTNASMLDEQTTRFLFDRDVSLVVSMDSLQEKKYDERVGACGKFREVMRNLQFARGSYEKGIVVEEGNRVVRIAVNMVVTKENKYEAGEVKAFCGDDALFVANYPIRAGAAEANWVEMAGEKNEWEELKKIAESVSENGGPLRKSGEGCGWLKFGLAVGSEGSILPCAYTQRMSGAFGNVRDGRMEEDYARVRKALREFEEEHGQVECIVRHEFYSKFLEANAKKENKK